MMQLEIRPEIQPVTENLRPGYVKKQLPFPLNDLLGKAIVVSETVDPNEVKARSHGRDSAWIGWQVNRNALGQAAGLTGFEPYFIGMGLEPAEIGDKLNQVGDRILKPLSWEKRMQVIRTIGDGTPTLDALIYLYGQFGATLAGLRAGMAYSPGARRYRNETATLCDHLSVQYPQADANVRVHALPPRVQLPPEIARPAALDTTGYDLMTHIGKVGDPLLWKVLEIPSDFEVMRRYNRFAFGR